MKTLMCIIFLFLFYSCQTSGNKKEVDSTDLILKQADSTIKAYDKEEQSWTYSDDTDKMTSKVSHFATITSTNELSLSPPYDGFNQAHLTLRKRRGVVDAVLEIDKGQFITGVYGTDVKVRFDKNRASTVYCEKAADYNPKVLYIESSQFIANIKRSKKLLIEATIYEAGDQQIEFNTTGLKWNY